MSEVEILKKEIEQFFNGETELSTLLKTLNEKVMPEDLLSIFEVFLNLDLTHSKRDIVFEQVLDYSKEPNCNKDLLWIFCNIFILDSSKFKNPDYEEMFNQLNSKYGNQEDLF